MKLQEIVANRCGKEISQCTNEELYYALLEMTKGMAEEKVSNQGKRKLYYISAEFLIGKLLSNNLINLGIYEDVKKLLADNGKSLAEIEEVEPEPSLGNGGLGRLAACFLDSIASLGLNGDGVGLNYHYGLFKQVFKNNLQNETPNPWIEKESWLTKTDVTYPIQFGGFTLQSRLYDIDVIGYENRTTKLHLFDVETVDESLVGEGIDFDKEDIAKNLTLFLYPDDSDDKGRILRVYQQYFMVSNAAHLIIDETLARGGDQVVVKNNKGISYYGGKREQTAKNTRVKARVKAEALREFITGKERVIVMGHKMADVDSFGAAIGIYRAASAMKKKVNIVLNDISVTLRPLYEAFTDDPKYPDDLFVTSHEAEELADDNTMVVVVDTNKPKMTECERLLRLTKTIAVLDHHRQSDEVIENAVLSYIEPYASSACEMVAEVLQYIGDDLRLNSMEANSMYAGILVDTNNFMSRTGVRTFEAAAYLRRCGADVTYVRKLLRDDMASYRAKAAVISSAEVYRDVFAIARGEHLGIESPTIIGAQASNELLNIEEIKASFVLTEYNGKIYISARSIDEINVQIIMERLGGGGHINTAGAQFPYSDMERAIETLKKTIDIMIEEGDI